MHTFVNLLIIYIVSWQLSLRSIPLQGAFRLAIWANLVWFAVNVDPFGLPRRTFHHRAHYSFLEHLGWYCTRNFQVGDLTSSPTSALAHSSTGASALCCPTHYVVVLGKLSKEGVCWTSTNLILPLNGASVTLSKPSLQSSLQPFPQFFLPNWLLAVAAVANCCPFCRTFSKHSDSQFVMWLCLRNFAVL